MPMLQSRGSIAVAAVVVALLSSRAADAQYPAGAGPTRQPGGLASMNFPGVLPEIVDQAKAERRLPLLQAKYSRDAQRGDSAAVDRDVRRINRVRYRISIDEWLIRKNSNQDPCFYPHPIPIDAMSCAAIADAARPSGAPPQAWRP